MNYAPEDSNPEAFLSKLHPDLPPYFEKLRSAHSGSESSVGSSSQAPALTLESSADHGHQMQQNLLDQQISAIAHLEHNFPLMPPELLEVISVVTNSLLAPVIFPLLFHHMANDNLEIFAYMLRRSSIFRDFPFTNAATARDEEVLDCTRWTAATCLRLMDQNWQLCFAEKAGKIEAPASKVDASRSGGHSGFAFADPAQSASSTSTSATGTSLSQSRWASSSSSPSSFSSRRNFSPSSHYQPSSNHNTTFHPSKVSALANAFALSHDKILSWSSARWRLVLEDLEVMLCRTAILADVPDGKKKAQLLLDAARKNVDLWKTSQP